MTADTCLYCKERPAVAMDDSYAWICTDCTGRLDAAVAAYRDNPSRANTAELMAAQKAWGAVK